VRSVVKKAGLVLNRSRQVPAEDTAAFGGIAERFRRAGDLDRAIALCREGLLKFPNTLSARVTLGWALLDKGQYGEARAELEQVLRRAPDNLAAIRGLAELHDRTDHQAGVDAHAQWQQDEAEVLAAIEAHAPPAEQAPSAVAPPPADEPVVVPSLDASLSAEDQAALMVSAPAFEPVAAEPPAAAADEVESFSTEVNDAFDASSTASAVADEIDPVLDPIVDPVVEPEAAVEVHEPQPAAAAFSVEEDPVVEPAADVLTLPDTEEIQLDQLATAFTDLNAEDPSDVVLEAPEASADSADTILAQLSASGIEESPADAAPEEFTAEEVASAAEAADREAADREAADREAAAQEAAAQEAAAQEAAAREAAAREAAAQEAAAREAAAHEAAAREAEAREAAARELAAREAAAREAAAREAAAREAAAREAAAREAAAREAAAREAAAREAAAREAAAREAAAREAEAREAAAREVAALEAAVAEKARAVKVVGPAPDPASVPLLDLVPVVVQAKPEPVAPAAAAFAPLELTAVVPVHPYASVLPMAPRADERRSALVSLEGFLRKVQARRLEVRAGSVA